MDGRSSDVTGSRAPLAGPALGALLDAEADADALERMLLAHALHPAGGGCARAWIALWNARTGLMEGWREAAAEDAGGDLVQRLGQARRAAPRENASPQTRAWAEAPERFEGALAESWRGAGIAYGAGGEQPGAPWSAEAEVGVMALRRGVRLYGVLVGSWRDAGARAAGAESFEALRVAADAAFGAQSRAAELRRRTRQLAALAEFAKTAVSAIHLAEAMHLLARLAAQSVGARGAAVYRVSTSGELLADVAFGSAALRDRFAEAFLDVARDTVARGQARLGERGEDAGPLPPGIAGETSVWAMVPLAAYGRVTGALLVHDGPERHPASPGFERGDVEFLAQIADHAALLIEHARQLDAARRAARNAKQQDARLRDLDRFASVGELAARVSNESRNPLSAVSAFTRRAQRELDDGDPRREYLEVVLRESARLEAMLLELSEYAKLERPRLKMQGLNAVVQEALQRSSETLVRRRIRLLKRLAPDLPMLLLDATRIQRVIENVLAYALECVPVGGRIQVESRRAGAYVVVEMAHDGARAGGDLLEHLFVPFAGAPTGGAAVGLSVAQQIVREHGGEIRVRADGEWSTVFAFTLPVAGNEDRRRSRDRRGSRSDRRKPPEAAA